MRVGKYGFFLLVLQMGVKEKSEIPRRCACGISVPSRGVRATMQQPNDLTVVRAVLVSVIHERARGRRIPKQPGACALGCCWLRRERDSNSRYPFGVHTLSRRASSATRASLQYVSGAFRSKPDCKGNHFFRKCKYRRGNFSTRGYKVRLWSMQPGYSSG